MGNIYVSNLSYSITEDELRELFSEFGPVKEVNIMKDRDTGRARGFGFVEMEEIADAQNAIAGLNGKSVLDRDLIVNEARPKKDRSKPRYDNNNSHQRRRY